MATTATNVERNTADGKENFKVTKLKTVLIVCFYNNLIKAVFNSATSDNSKEIKVRKLYTKW